MREFDILGHDADINLYDMWLVWASLGDAIARRAWYGQNQVVTHTNATFL
jgi:hypothetical protein